MNGKVAQRRAVFLDRDGVVVRDGGLVATPDELELFPETPGALNRLAEAGFLLVAVTNQAVVARGRITEAELENIHEALLNRIVEAGGPRLTAVYACPHHPNADVPAYRVDCDCRKPRPGMLLRAAREHGIDLGGSFLIGDRMTDVAAGAAAGCRTVLVQTGRHLDAPIESAEPLDSGLEPDCTCGGIAEAAEWILNQP